MRIKNLLLSSFLLVIVVGCSYQEKEISNYTKYGSNSYSGYEFQNVSEQESKCVSRFKTIIHENEILKNVKEIECLEVNNLGKDRYFSNSVFNLINNFFNSGAGMMLVSELIGLL